MTVSTTAAPTRQQRPRHRPLTTPARRGGPDRRGPAGRGRLHRRDVRRLLGRPSTTAAERAAPPLPPVSAAIEAAAFDGTRPWTLHPQVSLRPESFGALAYHFGTRRLSFLKSPTLLAVVQSLADQPTGHDACRAAGVSRRRAARPTSTPWPPWPTSGMICEREAP